MCDPFGIKPYGDAINQSVETACKFLEATCLPALEEYGLYLRDKVRNWRLENMINIILKTKKLREELGISEDARIHPRIMIKVIQEGSCVDDPDLQKMWSGLLASSSSKDGTDETNFIFVNVLSQMSSAQARVINYIVPESMSRFYKGEPCNPIVIEISILKEISGLTDLAILDRELNHLGSLGLISYHKRIDPSQDRFGITIEDVTLRFCASCNGYTKYADWTELFKDSSKEDKSNNQI